MLIAVCGNVGSGKTTLAKFLSKYYQFHFVPTNRTENLFIDDFFNNIPAYFFSTQLSFLFSKAEEIKKCNEQGFNIVLDRSIYEDINIFAKLWIDSCEIEGRIVALYQEISEYIYTDVPKPDIYIICKCSAEESRRRIGARAKRAYEEKYPANHIEILAELYNRLTIPEGSVIVEIDSERCDLTDAAVADRVVQYIFNKIDFLTEPQQLSIFLPTNGDDHLVIPEAGYINIHMNGYGTEKYRLPQRIEERKYAYIAAPFTSCATEERIDEEMGFLSGLIGQYGIIPKEYRKLLSSIGKIVKANTGLNIIIPHRDINRWGEVEYSAHYLLPKIIESVQKSSLLVAIPGKSIGTHFEIGLAISQKIPVVILLVDELENSFFSNGFESVSTVMVLRVKMFAELFENECWEKVKQFYLEKGIRDNE